MSKYLIAFSKKGDIKFTSHLDINRMFRRLLKKIGIDLAYSQGFNPHPKMNFAQPLSLGYEAENEMLEITANTDYKPWFIKSELENYVPEGVVIKECDYIDDEISSLAAIADEAHYEVSFPCPDKNIEKLIEDYLNQNEIIIEKLNKKKKIVKTDIREKIRSLSFAGVCNGVVVLDMKLDCGSASNLSPEFVLSTFFDFGKLDVKREDVDVLRKSIKFTKELKFNKVR